MKAKKVLRAIGEHLGLSRAEMEHVVDCTVCSIYDEDYCLPFRKEFRGYVPRELTDEEKARGKWISDLWSPALLAGANPIVRFEQFAGPAHVPVPVDHVNDGGK